MSLITISAFQYQLAAPLTSTDSVELRIWYTGGPGANFYDVDGNIVPYGSATNLYLPVACTVSAGKINIPSFDLSATDNSSNVSALASAQFYVNGAPSTFLFTSWIITATLGASISYNSLYTYNLAAQVAYTLSTLYLTAPQVAALIASAAGALLNASSTIKGITKLSVDPVSATNPIARGFNDVTNPFLVSRTSVPAVSGATAQGLDVVLTGNEDILNFGGLMGAKVALTWSGTGSTNHQTLQPFAAYAAHTGTGRIDFANVYTASQSNAGGGLLQDGALYYGQIQNTGASILGGFKGFFSDAFQSGTAIAQSPVSLFQGRFRNFSGTPSAAAVYGLYLTGWVKVGGSTVTTSSAIEIDDSTRIGTTPWTIHSTSLAPSLLTGALTTPVQDKGGQVFNVKAYGAVCDRVGTAGTDDTVAIQAAITAAEAAPGLGTVLIPGPCLVRKTSAGGSILTTVKGITIEGTGGRDLCGIYASTDTPNTVDILTYKPTSHPNNEGFTLRGLTVACSGMAPNGASPGAWTVTSASARHAVVLDDTGTAGNVAIRKVTIEKCMLGMTTLASGGGKGLVATSTSTHGCPAQSLITNNHIWNGVSMPGAGDTLTFSNNTMMGQNALDITQVSTATTLGIVSNNITFRGGINIPTARAPYIVDNVFELAEADSTGSGSALLQLGTGVGNGVVDANVFGCFPPSPNLNAIRLNTTDHVIIGLGNRFALQAGAINVQNFGAAAFNFLGVTESAAATYPITADNTSTVTKMAFAQHAYPGGTFGWPGYINQLGYIRSVGAAGQSAYLIANGVDTTLTHGLLFEVSGTTKGELQMVGSTHATSVRRNNIELINENATGSIGLYTNAVIGQGLFVNPAGIVSEFKGADVVSAAAIVPTGNLFHVTGTTNITSITSTGINPGARITIIFDGVLTFTDGSNLKLAGNFVTTADDTITLAYDGTNWYEIARSIN